MKKSLALSVAFIMVAVLFIAFIPAAPAQAADDPAPDYKVTRRALVIGNANYAMSPLTAPVYDAKHMEQLFKEMDFSGMTPEGSVEQGAMKDNITLMADRAANQIKNDITAAFAGADADDVSYFYYSGHGSVLNGEAQIVGVDMNYVSMTELKAILDPIPGTKVVLLDSCFSGGFIGKSSVAAAPAEGAKSPTSLLPAHNRTGSQYNRATPGAGLKKNRGYDFDALFPASLKQQPPKKEKPLSEQFNGSVEGVFSKTSKFIDSGRYVVITAAASNQYSYEFPFAAVYGPQFTMNGVEWANRDGAYSGEFTGMFVAGAGVVTFNAAFGENCQLADYNGDKIVTAEDLDYYLMGSVLLSDVRMYPSSTDYDAQYHLRSMPLFSVAGAPVNPARVVLGRRDPITTPVSDGDPSVNITVNKPANYDSKLVIYRNPKVTDGLAANGFVTSLAVKTYTNDQLSGGSVTWDGRDDNGNPVSDGTYCVTLETGADFIQEGDPPYVYPSAAVVMERGQTEFDHKIADSEFVSADGSWTASGAVNNPDTHEGYCYEITAPATGAMNVYANLNVLSPGLTVTCYLCESDGDIINYGSAPSGSYIPVFLPFAVEQGGKYCLKFEAADSQSGVPVDCAFPYELKLNAAVDVDSSVNGAGKAYEAWLIKPQSDADCIIRSTGDADTAGTLVDGDQIERIASNDDYSDKRFFMKASLVGEHPYLLVIKDYGFLNPDSYSIDITSAPPSFDASGIESVGDITTLEPFPASGSGGTTYRYIHTGDLNPERWTFLTDQSATGPEIGQDNDPYLMLMDEHYNLVAGNDDFITRYFVEDGEEEYSEDYREEYNAAVSAVLEPNTTYILCCRSSYIGSYDFTVIPNASRQTGDGNTGDPYVTSMPKAVFMDNGGLSMDRFGNVSSWGSNDCGELGQGTMSPSPMPQAVIMPGFYQARDVWASDTMAFARLSFNEYCYWGMPYYEMTGSLVPVTLYSLQGMDVAEIRCGAGMTALVRTYTGEIYMLDLLNDELEPIELSGAGSHSVKQIQASDFSFFALTYGGDLYSWGANWTGECGVGGTSPVDSPALVECGGGPIGMIAAGWDHVLALTKAGGVYAWGYNRHNELGVGYGQTLAKSPVKVDGGDIAGKTISAVYAGADHSMCVDADGNVYAWGINTFGELGLGNAAKVTGPKKVAYYDTNNIGVMAMDAGMFSVFAQDFSHNVYGYGSNMDFQLAHGGMPSKNGIEKLMTLRGPVVTDHSAELAAIHADSGFTWVSGDTVGVWIGEDTATCYIVPEPADSEATYTIGGETVVGKEFASPDPGGVAEPAEQIVLSHPGQLDKTYSLVIYRDECTNSKLRGIAITLGAVLSPEYSKDVNNYVVTLPEPMAGVTVTPEADGFGAHYVLDAQPVDKGKSYTLGVGKTLYSKITVTAQNDYYEDVYNLTVRRPFMLASLSATPKYGSYPSLSPGGTNRMRINYSLMFPATVKIEVLKSYRWYTLTTRTETAAGSLYWDWDGKLGSSYLAAGTYTIRVTPIYNGKPCTAKTLTVKIFSKPYVSIPSLTPNPFKATGSSRLTFSVRWSVISNVKVEILNTAGSVVYTVWNASNYPPTTKTLYWYGKNSSGTLLPAGTYRVRLVCGAASTYRTFTLRR